MRTDLAIDRAGLERRANALREGLVATIGEIEQRARAVTDVRLQWSRHQRLVGLSFIGVAAALSYAAYRLDRRLLRPGRRILALRRMWQHPEALARPRQPSILAELGRRLLVGSLSFAGMELMKRGIRRVVAAQPPKALAPSEERRLPRLLS
jgi:hypothetical protein